MCNIFEIVACGLKISVQCSSKGETGIDTHVQACMYNMTFGWSLGSFTQHLFDSVCLTQMLGNKYSAIKHENSTE
jgi:hypothetical protein